MEALTVMLDWLVMHHDLVDYHHLVVKVSSEVGSELSTFIPVAIAFGIPSRFGWALRDHPERLKLLFFGNPHVCITNNNQRIGRTCVLDVVDHLKSLVFTVFAGFKMHVRECQARRFVSCQHSKAAQGFAFKVFHQILFHNRGDVSGVAGRIGRNQVMRLDIRNQSGEFLKENKVAIQLENELANFGLAQIHLPISRSLCRSSEQTEIPRKKGKRVGCHVREFGEVWFVLRRHKHVLYSVTMSSDPPKNPNADDDSDPPELDSPKADSELDSDQEAKGATVADDNDDFEEEFSLDQLSQAYAEVLRTRAGESADPEDKPLDPLPPQDDELDDESAESESPQLDDNAACPISPESIIESILFVGCPKDIKLNSRKIAAILRDVSPKEVTKLVREINARYEKEEAAYRIESDGGVFKMILDPKLLDFQQDFYGRNRQVRLSQSAIDVMAVVAYNQPATRDQIEKIRRKPCGGVLSQLVKRELLSVVPGETDPKIKYYSTTDRFLDLFSLEEIADLPQSHEVSDIEELAD